MKSKSEMPSPLPEERARLRVPASPPRNPVAVNPLLKKSTAHSDKRRRAEAQETAIEIKLVKQLRKPLDYE